MKPQEPIKVELTVNQIFLIIFGIIMFGSMILG